jgi:hypothetical protein
LNLDTVLWVAGLVAEGGVVFLCIHMRLFRTVPMFSSYITWSLLVDGFFLYLHYHFPPSNPIYYSAYVPQMLIDSLFQFAVLVELGWAVLLPIRATLPKYSMLMMTFLIVLAGAIIWPVAVWTLPSNLPASWRPLAHIQQTFAALRVVMFVALAGFSQLLSIGWRNRELQIATGLGIYSLSSLAVAFLHTHQAPGIRYTQLDEFVMATYLFSLVYWLLSFAQREQERQEFTPQMRSFLLAVTGAARGTRVALANSGIDRPGKVGKP